MEANEDLADRFRKTGIHREPFPLPIAGGSELLELADDRPAGLFLPTPDALQKFFASERFPRRAFGLQLSLHHILRRNSGMVGAGHPEHIPSLHPAPADQDVLQRVVQGMTHMQRSRDIRRRDHHGVGLPGMGRVGVKQAGIDPALVPAVFDVVGIVGFIELWGGHIGAPAAARAHLTMCRRCAQGNDGASIALQKVVAE